MAGTQRETCRNVVTHREHPLISVLSELKMQLVKKEHNSEHWDSENSGLVSAFKRLLMAGTQRETCRHVVTQREHPLSLVFSKLQMQLVQ